MPKVVDYAFSRPADLSEVAGVVRYLAPLPNGKVIDKAEYDALIHAGHPVALVWEIDIRSWAPGRGTGVHHGLEARAQAHELGHPDDRPIYAAYDTSIAPGSADWNAAIAYQDGFNEGAGGFPQGAYAEAALLDELLRRGLIKWAWQTESRGFPGNSIDDPRACLIQRTWHTLARIPWTQVDENDVFATDWGQHPAPHTPAPTPIVLPTSEATVYLVQEKGSQTVHAIGAGPNGVTDIIGRTDDAYLNAWKAALVQQTGRKEAANVLPVEQGFVANIRTGH